MMMMLDTNLKGRKSVDLAAAGERRKSKWLYRKVAGGTGSLQRVESQY